MAVRPMHAMATLLAAAATLLAVGAAGAGAAPARQGAATTGASSPACPASIRSVPGGARDASTRGFDDGLAGPDQAYRPGQMLLRLDRGSTAAEFACVLKELGAVKLAGGRGRAGLAGMSDLMLVELPPARSVMATGRLLMLPRYRELMDNAQPNWLMQDAQPSDPAPAPGPAPEPPRPPCPDPNAQDRPFPNDTYFPLQWGLGPGNEAADTRRDIKAGENADNDTPCSKVPRWIGKVVGTTPLKVGDANSTMRVAQAWPLTKRWWWSKRSVTIGIIDDSLVQHPDLVGSVEPGGSRVITPRVIDEQVLSVKPGPAVQPGQREPEFTITSGGGDVSCPIPRNNTTPDDIARALDRRVAVMCDARAGANAKPYFGALTVIGTAGSMQIRIGADTADIPGDALHLGDGTRVTNALKANAALGALVDSGTLEMKPLARTDTCDVPTYCRRWIIAHRSLPTGTEVSVDGARLSYTPLFSNERPGTAALARSAFAVEAGTTPGVFRAELKTGMPDAHRWTFTPPDAAKVESVLGEGYSAEVPAAPNSGTWPGQRDGSPTAAHGQMIAGIIGAQADNGRGIAGVLGPYITPRIMMAVTPLDTAADLEAIRYLAGRKKVAVVNYSRGSSSVLNNLQDPATRARLAQPLPDPQKEDPRPTDLVQQAMAEYPGTLFVIAAGNESTNLNHLGPRAAQKASYDPCAPKGMGVTNPPGRSKDGRGKQTRGGALSMLRMPDGTFDRGNIICVASLAPPMQEQPDTALGKVRDLRLASSSSWGAGIVDVAAPGQGVIGTGLDKGYRVENGTSLAAPMVAGVAGMINALHPGLDPSLVKCAILTSATTAPLKGVFPWPEGDMPFAGYRMSGADWQETDVLTVPGMVVATEALSAAAHLKNKTSGIRNGRRVNEGKGPTCVQKRGALENGTQVWVDTPTKPVPKPPAPNPPAPNPPPP